MTRATSTFALIVAAVTTAAIGRAAQERSGRDETRHFVGYWNADGVRVLGAGPPENVIALSLETMEILRETTARERT